MNDEKGSLENLRVEYSEANNNRRHYSNLRFAALSVFFAVLGGVSSVAFGIVEIKSPSSPDIVLWARIAGLVFTIVFFSFEILGDLNLRHFGRVAKDLEDLLGYRQFKTRNFPYFPKALYFTWGMYVLLIAFWIFAICRRA
jgi:steroid 5-alpha reductase family enzyme